MNASIIGPILTLYAFRLVQVGVFQDCFVVLEKWFRRRAEEFPQAAAGDGEGASGPVGQRLFYRQILRIFSLQACPEAAFGFAGAAGFTAAGFAAGDLGFS